MSDENKSEYNPTNFPLWESMDKVMGERTQATAADPVSIILLLTVLWMILKLVFLVS